MGKNYNPGDAFRKQQKAKEAKKNAAERKRKRDEQAAKQDTRDLENEISELKSRADKLPEEGKERLKKLQTDLKFIEKAKKKYVAAHPEAADRIYNPKEKRANRRGYEQQHEEDEGDRPDPMAHLYNPDGTLKDPKKSVYYDPTYNPFGVPPPGMPYRERTPVPGESESESEESESDEESDDDIVMPEGPRPDESDDDSDDSDDIPLPEGPPPPRLPPQSQRGRPVRPMPRGNPNNPGGWGHLMPTGQQPARPPRAGPSVIPPRPGGLPAAPSSLPAKPGSIVSAAPAVVTSKPVAAAPAVISAEPQIRDLRKETTVFVPRGVAKKKAPSGLAPVNAAPSAGKVDAEGDTVRVRQEGGTGLLGKLHGVLGAPPKPADTDAEDEYARFLEGLDQ